MTTLKTYRVEFEGCVYNYDKLAHVVDDVVTVRTKSSDIDDIQPAVEELYGYTFGSFYLNKVVPLDVTEEENDLVRFAAFRGLTYAETVTLPAIIERISEKTHVREETLIKNIATFDNELSRYVASVARRVAKEVDDLTDKAPA